MEDVEDVHLPAIVIHNLKRKWFRTQLHFGWDPCPVKTIAPPSWSREENGEHGTCWILKDSKLDGMYVWLRPRTETSDSNYGLEVPDFESESESESESDLEVDASVESDSDVPSVKSSPSSSDAELLALSALINPPPRAATSVASSTSSSDSEPKRQSPRAATSVASSTSSSDSEPEFPAVAQRAATSVASSTSSSDSEPEFPAVAQPSRAATPDEPLSSHHTDWDMDSKAEPEEWDMEETAPVKRSTPQYLIAVKEGEWDEFVAGLVSKK
ncbi:hypothetical protein DFH06DRAFT_1342546 [Mycena polygramma]|nr:hypothetical protein DFH06DRAFT_1342546 [Mycena polygramma]